MESYRIKNETISLMLEDIKKLEQANVLKTSHRVYDTLLGVVEIDPFTGKKYNAIKKVKCTCTCHEPNSNTMHCFPCCDDGYNEIRLFVE